MVWWWWRKRQGWKGKCGACVCVCRTRLCNPFRESAERGTQTPEWGKNSVSSPLPSTLFLCLQRSGFPALPYTPVSHGSRLRGNQAKHKLGRRIVVIFTNHETYGKRETTGCSPSSLTLRLPHPRQPPDRKTGPRLIHRNRPLFF